MGSRVNRQYRDSLTPEQVAAGMNAALQNARRLADDAKVLAELGRYPSAASLAILSIEEAGKTSILRELALARDQNEVRGAWKDYRSHTAKNIAWILPDLVRKGARTLDELRPIVDRFSDHPRVLDSLKQLAFYTDCLNDGDWSIPDNVITADIAKALVSIAEIFLHERPATTEEIELWVEHLQPVWRGPMEWMKTASIQWYEAMRERGIVKDGDMEAFLRGKSPPTTGESLDQSPPETLGGAP